MAATAMKLSELSPGDTGVVSEFPHAEAAFIRLREMGLLTGTRVTLVRIAPLGDPIEIKVRGYSLSLRKADAARILVELLP
jgi:Fe2+ transport system protein FeoA